MIMYFWIKLHHAGIMGGLSNLMYEACCVGLFWVQACLKNRFSTFSCNFNCWKTCRAGLGFLQGFRPENLASRSLVAKLISRDIDGQIHCRLLPVSGSRCGRLLVYKQKRLFKVFVDNE